MLNEVRYSRKLILYICQRSYLSFRFLEIQSLSIVRIEFFNTCSLHITFFKILIVVEVTVVGRHCIEVAHVDSFCSFFFSEKCLVHLFAVANTDNLDFFLLAAEKFADSFCLSLDGASRSLLDQDVAILAVLKSKENQIDGLFQAHDEAGHGGLGDGDGVALADLVYPERNDGA